FFFFFQAEDGIRDFHVTGVQTCALPIYCSAQIAKVLIQLLRYGLGLSLNLGTTQIVPPPNRCFHLFYPNNGTLGSIGHVPNYPRDRKSTRLNSSHVKISYAVFCLKKKNE